MSQENVEIVHNALEAVTRQPPDWETVNALFDPEHELIELPDFVDRADEDSGVGAAGFRNWRAKMNRSGSWRVVLEEYRGAPDGDVVVRTRVGLTGGRGGVYVDQGLCLVVSVRDGKVVRTRAFRNWHEALKAVGLEE